MFTKKPLIQAIAIALVAPLTVSAANDATCIGNFFEQSEEVPNVTPPTVRMITHQMLQLTAGESLVIALESTSESGEPSFLSCADQGQLTLETDDFSQIKYTAPPYIQETQIIQWGVQISDNLGYVGGDSLLLRLIASGTGNPYIIVGTPDKILIYSPTGDLENDIAAIAQQLVAIDSDNDGLEEIVADDGSNITAYEFNGQASEPNTLSDNTIFLVKADVNGDGNQETITGSQTANEVSVASISFPVFTDITTATRRANRKNTKVTICHKGKTKAVPEPALKGHLGHGDSLGACSSGNQNPDKDKEPEKKQDNNDKKVTICHKGKQTITISQNALPAHLAHGDKQGACPSPPPPPPPPDIIYGVNVAAGDFNGDGNANIVAAMAQNGSIVEIYTGDGQLLNSFKAFENNNGVLVATGDVTGNGQANIITAEPNGSEIRIFDANGTQTAHFPVNGNIISLAVGMGVIKEVEPSPDDSSLETKVETNNTSSEATTTQPDDSDSSLETPDKPPEAEAEDLKTNSVSPTTTIYAPPTVSPPPLDGEIIGVHNYHGQTVTDATIDTDSSISNPKLAGDIINYGLVSNAWILPNTTFTGGTLTGYINNAGTIADIKFVGAELIGGELAGTIIVNSETKPGLGILADITLAKDTYLQGGILTGTVTGDAESQALIEDAKIRANTELSHVIIGAGCQLDAEVNIGAGVSFVYNDLIPAGADLTAALLTDDGININTDVLVDTNTSNNLLAQINEVPEMQLNDWQLTSTDDNGQPEVMLEGTAVAVIPLQINQAKRTRHAQIIWHDDNSITIVTATGREILVQIVTPDL